MTIRPERPTDAEAVRAVNQAAFETTTEANLVKVLHEQASSLISLVAEDAGSIVGHSLFSPAVLLDHPDVKNHGIGTDGSAAGAPTTWNRLETRARWH